jgi:hypothetical protein
MATPSAFDPQQVAPEFYSQNPQQHGTSDYGRESEGVGNNTHNSSTSGSDMETGNRNDIARTRAETWGESNPDAPKGESVGTYQEWDIDPDQLNPDAPKRGMTEAEAQKLESISDNPSDEALFKRADATYLEQGDNPNASYDPHNKGYDNKEGKVQE